MRNSQGLLAARGEWDMVHLMGRLRLGVPVVEQDLTQASQLFGRIREGLGFTHMRDLTAQMPEIPAPQPGGYSYQYAHAPPPTQPGGSSWQFPTPHVPTQHGGSTWQFPSPRPPTQLGGPTWQYDSAPVFPGSAGKPSFVTSFLILDICA
jgi:hypothetical protein